MMLLNISSEYMGSVLQYRFLNGILRLLSILCVLSLFACKEETKNTVPTSEPLETVLPVRDSTSLPMIVAHDTSVAKAILKDSASLLDTLKKSTIALDSSASFPLVVLRASGSGHYSVGESVSLISENHNDSGMCFIGWKVFPEKYKDYLKVFEMDSAHFVMPQDTVNIEALYRSCYEGLESVKIGNLLWMTRNLNVWTFKGSSCYDDERKNCKTYGRLYDYETAKTVCASGWRLPTDQEWTQMMAFVGAEESVRLKAKQGWADDGNTPGNGSDAVGFQGLPAGIVYEGQYMYIGYHAYFWTATEKDSSSAWYRSLSYDNVESYRYYNFKSAGYSVRCVKEDGVKPATANSDSAQ
jgi:uncharacterized protein (TIGR02145 family)